MTIEEYCAAGSGLSESLAPTGNASGAAFFAHLRLTPRVDEISDVVPPPWLGWDHEEDGVWPQSDDSPEDLNTFDSPDWLTSAAQHVREVLLGAAQRVIVEHGDSEAQNVIIWEGENLAVLHDWDSIAALPEPALVGAAAGGVRAQRVRTGLGDARRIPTVPFRVSVAAGGRQPRNETQATSALDGCGHPGILSRWPVGPPLQRTEDDRPWPIRAIFG